MNTINWHIPMHKVFGGLRGERVRAARLPAYCNYLSKKNLRLLQCLFYKYIKLKLIQLKYEQYVYSEFINI